VVGEQGVTPLFDVKNEFREDPIYFVSGSQWTSAEVAQMNIFMNSFSTL